MIYRPLDWFKRDGSRRQQCPIDWFSADDNAVIDSYFIIITLQSIMNNSLIQSSMLAHINYTPKTKSIVYLFNKVCIDSEMKTNRSPVYTSGILDLNMK